MCLVLHHGERSLCSRGPQDCDTTPHLLLIRAYFAENKGGTCIYAPMWRPKYTPRISLTTWGTYGGKANEFARDLKEVLVWDRACQARVKSPRLWNTILHIIWKRNTHIIHSTSFLSHLYNRSKKLLKVNLWEYIFTSKSGLKEWPIQGGYHSSLHLHLKHGEPTTTTTAAAAGELWWKAAGSLTIQVWILTPPSWKAPICIVFSQTELI